MPASPAKRGEQLHLGGVKPSEKGFSLIELLLVIAVLGSVVFLLASLPNALMLIGKSKHMSLAREIALKQLEDKRSINYSNLVNDSSEVNDIRLSLLPQGSGTVEVLDCDSSICTQGENVKQATVTVNWRDNNKPQTVILKTMIGEGGINQ